MSDNPYEPPKSGNADPATPPRRDWTTWSPFQSDLVRQICENLTPDERRQITKRGVLYGLWVAATVAIPGSQLSMALAAGRVNPVLATIASVLVFLHLACIPVWQRMQKQFLCQTKWAVSRGLDPEALSMFQWRRR